MKLSNYKQWDPRAYERQWKETKLVNVDLPKIYRMNKERKNEHLYNGRGGGKPTDFDQGG